MSTTTEKWRIGPQTWHQAVDMSLFIYAEGASPVKYMLLDRQLRLSLGSILANLNSRIEPLSPAG